MSQTNNGSLRRFVTLFEGRSGSTFLVEALDSHPQIRAEKELLAALKKKVDKGKAAPENQLQCIERLFAPGEFDYEVVGFKTKPKDVLDPAGFAELLRQSDARVILLQRRNRIKLLVSLLNAMQLNEATGDWNLYNESDRQPMLRPDVNEFKQWLERTEEANRELNHYAKGLELPILELFYEDILTEREQTFRHLCNFLEVEHHAMTGLAKKNTSDDLRDVVKNFEELKASFVGTPYESMFDEVMRPAST